MKAFWHTKTLFIEWWKYKWSRKYDHCVECWQCKFKHKWRWYCTSCWDKEQYRDDRREQKRQAWKKWHEANYTRIPREQWKKMWHPVIRTPESIKAYNKEWYQKNKYVLSIMKRWKLKYEKGQEVMQYRWYFIDIRLEEWDTDTRKKAFNDFQKVRAYIDKRIWNTATKK